MSINRNIPPQELYIPVIQFHEPSHGIVVKIESEYSPIDVETKFLDGQKNQKELPLSCIISLSDVK